VLLLHLPWRTKFVQALAASAPLLHSLPCSQHHSVIVCWYMGLCVTASVTPGVHDAPDDSWLVSYDPAPKQQQQGQSLHVVPKRQSSSERLQANPSLASWQAEDSAQTHTAAAAAAAALAAAAAVPSRPTSKSSKGHSGGGGGGGSGQGGSGLVRQGSSRMEALLDDFEQGVTPSLLDLAEL
jgi:hypothetical protein